MDRIDSQSFLKKTYEILKDFPNQKNDIEDINK